jgi:hypothetical protein
MCIDRGAADSTRKAMTNLDLRSTRLRSTLSLLLALLTAGCSTTQVMRPAVAPTEGKALVHFIRKSYPPYVRELRLYVNGDLLATIANNDFVAVNVPVGKNAVLLEANDGKPLSFELSVDKPEHLYVILTGDVRKTGTEISGLGKITVYLRWSLRAYAISRAEAVSVVAEFGKQLQ